LLTVDRRVRVVAAAIGLLLAGVAWSADAPKTPTPLTMEAHKLPFKQTTDAEGGMALRVIGGLVVVVLIGFGVIVALKRYVPSIYGHSAAGAHRINVLETRRLTPKATLFLVEVDGTRLLLAQSGDRVVTLHEAASGKPVNAAHERA
jgi:flagellar biogenesis protein FliO